MLTTLLLAEEEKPNPIIPHVPEIIVGLVVFALLYFLLKRYAFPQFEKAFSDRSAAIEGGLAKAEQAQAEAQAALEQYRAQLADARAESARILEKARADAQVIVTELREQAQSDAADIVAKAERQIEADRARAFTELRGEIGRLSVELAEKIVGESLTDTALQGRVVDRFLADLETSGSAQEPVA